MQVFLEPDPFLNELTKLYERNRQSGTVWVTLKRCMSFHLWSHDPAGIACPFCGCPKILP